MEQQTKRGVLIVLSGPSGTGKGTVCGLVRQHLGSGSILFPLPHGNLVMGKNTDGNISFTAKKEFEALREQNGFLNGRRFMTIIMARLALL